MEQVKDIRYRGMSTSPSDYLCPDGDLIEANGLVWEDGALKAIAAPKELFQLPQGALDVFVHQTPSFRHYIYTNSIEYEQGSYYYELSWAMSDEPNDTQDIPSRLSEIHQLTSIGNTLIALTHDGVHYFLFTEGRYKDLGTQLPQIQLSIGLQGVREERSCFIDFVNDVLADLNQDLLPTFSEMIRKVTERTLGEVNKYIADVSQRGKFIFPFFVRYALRLYDGALVRHSAPILMIPNSRSPFLLPYLWYRKEGDSYPIIQDSDLTGGHTPVAARFHIRNILCDLDYALMNSNEFNRELSSWKDIVKSVEVYISAPIYTYNQAGLCRVYRFDNEDLTNLSRYGICRTVQEKNYGIQSSIGDIKKALEYLKVQRLTIELPQFSTEDQVDKVKGIGLFYHLKSIPLSSLDEERKVLKIPEGYLPTLTSRERMIDDYASHEKLSATLAFPYNNRLNLAGITKRLFSGFLLSEQSPYIDSSLSLKKIDTYVYIKTSGQELVVKATDAWSYGSIYHFFYPNEGAYRADIVEQQTGRRLLTLHLEPHPLLNGAIASNGFRPFIFSDESEPYTAPEQRDTVQLPNKIYTSEVDNPFVFPPLGINTIPSGRVLGISSATKALSEGQFGQFPLYAFTDSGIWALEVSETGTYRAKQPISRDVCINPKSITQIDNAVVFASDRGIMLVSGAQVVPLSDDIDKAAHLDTKSLPSSEELERLSGLSTMQTLPFSEYIKSCRILYDYPRARLVIFRQGSDYAYVYGMRDSLWSTMPTTLSSTILSYPESLAITTDGKLVDASKASTEITNGYRGILYTRPIKLDMPDIHKAINMVIQRGKFRSGHVQTALYASDDLLSWRLIASSRNHILHGFRGRGYRYYIIALICSLDEGESVSGCTVRYVAKHTNRPR